MRKLITVLGILTVLVVFTFIGLSFYTKSHSPEEIVKFTPNGSATSFELIYCRPSKKDREIFGKLVPYNQVWRTGANGATTFFVDRDCEIGGTELKEGDYSLWTVPGETEWTVIINSETGQWGTNYEAEHDLFSFKVPAGKASEIAEMFTIKFEDTADFQADMILQWDMTEVRIPFKVKK